MKIKKGLKNVIVLESKISRIDGKKGILEYRGYSIHDLVEYSCFEEVVYLLWYGHLPSSREIKEFLKDLSKQREVSPEIIKLLKILPKDTDPIIAIRTVISYLGSLDRNLRKISKKENLEKSKRLLAKTSTVIAYYQRIVEGKPLIHPKKNLGHAANFLWMLKGKEPLDFEEKVLDSDLILHAEHGLNPSTFTARIAASTLSDIYAGIAAAAGVLAGPLHGGASEEVIKMLREIKDEKNISVWLKRKLEKKEKIPGFGHRVYKTEDPRAKELKKLGEKLAKTKKKEWLFFLSNKLVEEVRKKKRNLYPNVDFYTSSVYPNLGIPDKLFINMFAMARVAGWSAHMMEQYEDNELIRPLEKYIGEKNKKYA